MNGTLLTLLSPAEMGVSMADRLRVLRLRKGWTRETLARRAGVSTASLKRFETSGKGSLELVLKIAHALDRLEEFSRILQPPPASTIKELEQQRRQPLPKRGRR